MRSVGAIFVLTLRALLRSRFLLSVVSLAAFVVVVLPLTLQDDGTASGRAQVLIRYTLGAVTFLLSVGTLGAAPGLVAGELESRRLQQALVKPVRFGQVWLGKWLALAAVNAAALAGAVLLADGLMRWTMRESRLGPGQADELNRKVRVARTVLAPVETRFTQDELDARAGEMRRRGEFDVSESAERGRLLAARKILNERSAVPPGGTGRWTFNLPRGLKPGVPLTLRVRFLSSAGMERPETEGEWTVGEKGRAPVFRASARLRASVPQEVIVPPLAATPPGPLEVCFYNGEKGVPATVLFHPLEGVQLLVPAGSYGPNLLRAFLLILFKLVLLAAVGVTMGALLSSPVAALTSFFALVVFGFSGYIGWVAERGVFYEPHQHGPDCRHEEEKSAGFAVRALDAGLKAAYRGVNRILAPVRELEPMSRVAEGERVPWSDVGRGLFSLVGVGCGFWAALAMALFGRRETG